jgi:hypothetical protein
MASFGESMQELLSKVATSLGIKASESRRLEMVTEKLEDEKKRYSDKIEDLIDEIQRLEALALGKKKRMDAGRGETRRILGREIEQLLRERSGLKEKEALLFARREKVDLILRKFAVAKEAEVPPEIDYEEYADEAADLMQEVIASEKDSDRATEALGKIRFEEPERPAVDIEKEMASIEGGGGEFELSGSMLDALSELEGAQQEPEPEPEQKSEPESEPKPEPKPEKAREKESEKE